MVSDVPVGWVTLVLAVATTGLAIFAWRSSRDAREQINVMKDQREAMKEQVQAMRNQGQAMKEQGEVMRDQFDASTKPVIVVSGEKPMGFGGGGYNIVVTNHGNGKSIGPESVTVKNEAGDVIGTAAGLVLEPGRDKKIYVPIPAKPQVLRVSISGVKDVLGRSIPDFNDFEVTCSP